MALTGSDVQRMVMSYSIRAAAVLCPAERFPHEAHLQGAGTLGGREVALVEQYAVPLAPLT